jgi:hypothetical protein
MLNFKAIVFVLGSVLVVSSADAQTTTNAAPASPQRSFYRRSTLDERVKRFAKALNLDETQQVGLKKVLEHQQVQTRQIQLDQSLSGTDRISRIRDLQRDTVSQIRALLNEEQKKKYDPLNHTTETNSSDSYVNDWLKTPQR